MQIFSWIRWLFGGRKPAGDGGPVQSQRRSEPTTGPGSRPGPDAASALPTEPPPASVALSPMSIAVPVLNASPSITALTAPARSQEETRSPAWLAKMPKRVAFVDVETTGLTEEDRIVSLAVILLETAGLIEARFSLRHVHIICDPGRKSHPRAEIVHGYSDWSLRHQEIFAENVEAVVTILNDADLIVAHNVEFDMSFINREICAAGYATLEKEDYCTMKTYRQRASGRSGLDAVAAQIGIARSGQRHTALEDAWLAMMIYLWLNDCPIRFPISVFKVMEPTNLKPVPPVPVGPLPRRKKVAAVEVGPAQPSQERIYDDDDLQAAWEFFEKKDYNAAWTCAQGCSTL